MLYPIPAAESATIHRSNYTGALPEAERDALFRILTVFRPSTNGIADIHFGVNEKRRAQPPA